MTLLTSTTYALAFVALVGAIVFLAGNAVALLSQLLVAVFRKQRWQPYALADFTTKHGLHDFEGYEVTLYPEGRAIHFKRISTRSAGPMLIGKERKGGIEFSFGVFVLDRYFRTRSASTVGSTRLQQNVDQLAPLVRFLRAKGHLFSDLAIYDTGARAVFRSPFFSGFPSKLMMPKWLRELHAAFECVHRIVETPELAPVHETMQRAAAMRRGGRSGGYRSAAGESDPPVVVTRDGQPVTMRVTGLVHDLHTNALPIDTQVRWPDEQRWVPLRDHPDLGFVFARDQPLPSLQGDPPRVVGWAVDKARMLACLHGPAAAAGLVATMLAGTSLDVMERVDLIHRSKSWPSAIGAIQSKKVRSYEVKSCTSSSSRHGGSSQNCTTKTRYAADVVFEYRVKGSRYRSSWWSVQDPEKKGFSDADDARQVMTHLDQGTKVMVYYDPSDPKQGALERGVTDSADYAASYMYGVGAPWVVALLLLGLFATRLDQLVARARYAVMAR